MHIEYIIKFERLKVSIICKYQIKQLIKYNIISVKMKCKSRVRIVNKKKSRLTLPKLKK